MWQESRKHIKMAERWTETPLYEEKWKSFFNAKLQPRPGGWKSIWRKCVLMGQMHHRHGAIGRLPDFPSPLNPALFSAELKHSKRRKRENIVKLWLELSLAMKPLPLNSCKRPMYEIWLWKLLLTQPSGNYDKLICWYLTPWILQKLNEWWIQKYKTHIRVMTIVAVHISSHWYHDIHTNRFLCLLSWCLLYHLFPVYWMIFISYHYVDLDTQGGRGLDPWQFMVINFPWGQGPHVQLPTALLGQLWKWKWRIMPAPRRSPIQSLPQPSVA